MKNQQKKIIKRIINNAKEEFILRGFKLANVDNLAKAIGISKATLYKYIPQKDLLFKKCFIEHLNEYASAFKKCSSEILEVSEQAFFSKLFAMIRISSKFIEITNKMLGIEEKRRFPDLYEKLQAFASKQIEANFRIILSKGKELKLIRSEVDDVILFHIINYSLMNLSELHINLSHRFSASELLYKYFSIIFKGILNEQAFPLYNQQIKEITYEN
jgi:AcrR family transcriptional regulator